MKNPDALKQQKEILNRMNQAVQDATLRVCEDFVEYSEICKPVLPKLVA